MSHYSIAKVSALAGVSMRQAQVWSELGILSRDIDPEDLANWRLALRLRRRGLRLDLIAQVLEAHRATGAPFVIVDREQKSVEALHVTREVLRRFASRGSKLMLVDLR